MYIIPHEDRTKLMAALTKKSIAAIKKAGHSDRKKPVSEVTDVKSSGCPVRPTDAVINHYFKEKGLPLPISRGQW